MYLEKINLDITVVNPRFLTGLDEELLNSLKENHELVIALKDGELMGVWTNYCIILWNR